MSKNLKVIYYPIESYILTALKQCSVAEYLLLEKVKLNALRKKMIRSDRANRRVVIGACEGRERRRTVPLWH